MLAVNNGDWRGYEQDPPADMDRIRFIIVGMDGEPYPCAVSAITTARSSNANRGAILADTERPAETDAESQL